MPPKARAGPLHNLTQIIYVDSRAFVLRCDASSVLEFKLYSFKSKEGLSIWERMGGPTLAKLPVKQDELAEAIKGGYIHLEFEDAGDDTATIQLQITPPGMKTMTWEMTHEEVAKDAVRLAAEDLFAAAVSLLGRSATAGDSKDKAELRALRAELTAKEVRTHPQSFALAIIDAVVKAEVTHLTAKLASAKATVARTNGTANGKKVPPSPQKKGPTGASALQPNAKRRKIVEDEFAGSSDDEDAF